jgi:hypothetical protein
VRPYLKKTHHKKGLVEWLKVFKTQYGKKKVKKKKNPAWKWELYAV